MISLFYHHIKKLILKVGGRKNRKKKAYSINLVRKKIRVRIIMKQPSSLLREHYNQFINIYDKMDWHLFIWKPSLMTKITSYTQQNSDTSIKLKK